ncbi:hypothetical protein Q9L42_007280 [Methylomarinum sp. Ch1-1]|uniref:Uncharacterized protein n=1 Tax=Methylomarinum roseum TaxID=3067653 RepID=A0AAU7NY81_9GAMM|nr:hypothetical protein [Methylomarinum sp. Ch1-1]MDP4521980.1 hypothetical protein [Methylomarinum sp. Ch1-1]
MAENEFISEKRKFQIEEAILILLLLLSVVGIGITDYSSHDGFTYWLFMVMIFGLFAILIAWLQSKKHDMLDFTKILKEQFMHWTASLLVVGGAFLLQKSEQLNETNASLVILLILSLAAILDGIRIGWRFSFVGLFLGISAIVMAYFDNFMWLEVFIAIAIVAITILWEIWITKRAKNEEY